jgi:hypothetical protein
MTATAEDSGFFKAGFMKKHIISVLSGIFSDRSGGIFSSKAVLLLTLIFPSSVLFSSSILSAEEGKKTSLNEVASKSLLPLGTWHYGIYAGTIRLGTAHSSLSFEKGRYISVNDMVMQRDNGALVCIMKENYVETDSFVPVSYFSLTTIISGDKESHSRVSASFSKGTVALKDDSGERSYAIEGDFYITPNVIAVRMDREGMKSGSEYTVRIYDPSVDEEKALEMKEKIIGSELVALPKGKAQLIHTVQSYGPLKNINNYLDDQKTVVRTTLSMLNMTIDLVLEGYDTPKGIK